jgi:hypothetical protein
MKVLSNEEAKKRGLPMPEQVIDFEAYEEAVIPLPLPDPTPPPTPIPLQSFAEAVAEAVIKLGFEAPTVQEQMEFSPNCKYNPLTDLAVLRNIVWMLMSRRAKSSPALVVDFNKIGWDNAPAFSNKAKMPFLGIGI